MSKIIYMTESEAKKLYETINRIEIVKESEDGTDLVFDKFKKIDEDTMTYNINKVTLGYKYAMKERKIILDIDPKNPKRASYAEIQMYIKSQQHGFDKLYDEFNAKKKSLNEDYAKSEHLSSAMLNDVIAEFKANKISKDEIDKIIKFTDNYINKIKEYADSYNKSDLPSCESDIAKFFISEINDTYKDLMGLKRMFSV